LERNRSFEHKYIKYLVKSHALFYSFLLLFVGVFLFASIAIKLDVRKIYPANAEGNKITVTTDNEIMPIDGKLYLYLYRNEEIVSVDVLQKEFADGHMTFYINENPIMMNEKITLEITVAKETLLSRIFAKAGRS